MEQDNEYDEMRELLRRSSMRAAPVGLDQKIMGSIVAFDGRRRRRRQALASWLRFVAVGLVVILLASIFGSQVNWNVSGKLTADNIAGLAAKSGDAGRWLADHSYYLLPLMLLLFRRPWRRQNG